MRSSRSNRDNWLAKMTRASSSSKISCDVTILTKMMMVSLVNNDNPGQFWLEWLWPMMIWLGCLDIRWTTQYLLSGLWWWWLGWWLLWWWKERPTWELEYWVNDLPSLVSSKRQRLEQILWIFQPAWVFWWGCPLVHWLGWIPYTMGGSQLSFLFCPSFSAELQWFSNFAGGEMLTTGNHEMSQMPTGRFSMSRMSGRLSTLISQIHQSSLTLCSSAGDFSWTFTNTSSWCLISGMNDIFPLRICHQTLSVNYRLSPLISPTGTKVAISPHEFAFWGKASRLRDHFWQLVIEFRPWHFDCEKCECLNPAAFSSHFCHKRIQAPLLLQVERLCGVLQGTKVLATFRWAFQCLNVMKEMLKSIKCQWLCCCWCWWTVAWLKTLSCWCVAEAENQER